MSCAWCCSAWTVDWAGATVGALLVAGAHSSAFLHLSLALGHASGLVESAALHAIVRFVSAQVAADLLDSSMFVDAVWWRRWSRAVLVADLVVARAAVGTVRVAGTVVRALVEVVIVALVLAKARSVTGGETLVSNGDTVINAFLRFIAPDNQALLDDGRILGITAPSWAGAAVGALLVAWARVHAGVFVRSADRQASWVSVASEGAVIRCVSALRSALLPKIIVVRIFETVRVWFWHSFWAVAVAELVPLGARAAKRAVSVAWAISRTLLNVFVVAFVFARSSGASRETLGSLVRAVFLTCFCFVSPNGEALVFVGDSAAPSWARTAKRTFGVARAVGDADIFIESAITVALAITWSTSDGAVVRIRGARVSALFRDIAVVIEAVLVRIGKVRTVGVAKHVIWWASATVGAVSMAGTLG